MKIFKYKHHKQTKHKNDKTGEETIENEESEDESDNEDEIFDDISESKIKSEPESMSDEDNNSIHSKKNINVKINKVKLRFSKK